MRLWQVLQRAEHLEAEVTVSPDPLELFPRARLDPGRFARGQIEQFTGRRLRIGGSGVVHEVSWRSWLGDLVLPVPACHQGWSGFAAAGDLTPTTHPATCRKCAVRSGSSPAGDGAGQPGLFELDEPGSVVRRRSAGATPHRPPRSA